MKYTKEYNIQFVIAYLKANNIKKIVASPGATNATFVASMQHDNFFEIYSVVDERSAAYVACGLAEESGEIVALSCTGATSSRNYLPGLTEAYYRKLPVLAITSSLENSKVGHLYGQVTDRSTPPVDSVRGSFYVPIIKDAEDKWQVEITLSKAISLLHINGGGPVHINVATVQSHDFSTQELPSCRNIKVIETLNSLPRLPHGRIGIFVGSHSKFSNELSLAVDTFCEKYDSVVFCDHSSGYKGKYRFLSSLAAAQENGDLGIFSMDLLIHIGEVSGDYFTLGALRPKQVWRISMDGEIRDRFRLLSILFKLPELEFFKYYSKDIVDNPRSTYLRECMARDMHLRAVDFNLPFSNMWIAGQLCSKIPHGSCMHFGILQSLRSWNFFEVDKSIDCYSNVGGFGIDGNFSTLFGASLVNPDRLYFGVVGDLSFFYDINVIGNRTVGKNIRLLVINNGKGVEFRTYNHFGDTLGEETDCFIAAAGHNGNKSGSVVKDLATNLGYKYITANDKDSFELQARIFTDSSIGDCPIIFEVFTNTHEEREPLVILRNLVKDRPFDAKDAIRKIVGDSGKKIIKSIISKKI